MLFKRNYKRAILKRIERAGKNILCVESAYFVYAGALVTHLVKEGNDVRFYSGNPFEDECVEEIQFIDKEEENEAYYEIIDNL